MKVIILIATMLISLMSYTQTTENTDKLIEKYGENRYTEMIANNPDLIEYLDYRLSNGYVLLSSVAQKYQDLPIKESFEKNIDKHTTTIIEPQELINEINNGSFNLLLFNFEQKKTEDVVIRIGQNHVLIIRSVNSLNHLKEDNQ